jgi:hypothetical protein
MKGHMIKPTGDSLGFGVPLVVGQRWIDWKPLQ